MLEVESAGLTDVGQRRSHNEDAVLVAPELQLYAVCDGVGGHAKGDVASKLAVETLRVFFRDEYSVDEIYQDDDSVTPAAGRLLSSVHEANAQVYGEGLELPQKESMGSTLVAAHAAGGVLYVVHVGDSRCYRYREGRLAQLTRDHNVRNDALRLDPTLTEEILDRLPRHVVTRALGHDVEVEPDICSVTPWVDDLYLLCSDGLSGLVSDDDIAGTLEMLGDDLEIACEELVSMANTAGGNDNISVVLVRVTDAEPPEETTIHITVRMPPCEWCGAKWASDMTFCVSCGRPPMDPDEEDEIQAHCAECDAELLPDTRFCGQCGTPHGLYEDD